MSRPSAKSTIWFSRSTPLVSVVTKEPPVPLTLCPSEADPRLSLPSHSGCRPGSAMSSNTASAGASTSISVLTTLRAGSIEPKTEGSGDGSVMMLHFLACSRARPDGPHSAGVPGRLTAPGQLPPVLVGIDQTLSAYTSSACRLQCRHRPPGMVASSVLECAVLPLGAQCGRAEPGEHPGGIAGEAEQHGHLHGDRHQRIHVRCEVPVSGEVVRHRHDHGD